MRLINACIGLFFLSLSLGLKAQVKTGSAEVPADSTLRQSSLAYLEKGGKDFEEYSFSPAIDVYEVVYREGYVSADLLKKLGDSYFFNAQYEKAHSYYTQLLEEFPEEMDANYYFRLSQTSRAIGEYEKSEEMLGHYRAMNSLSQEEDPYFSLSNQLARVKENSERYKLRFFPYNTHFSEFAPSFNRGKLIFASDRDTGNFARYRHTWNQRDFLDLYQVDLRKPDSLAFEGKFAPELNSRLHESSTAFTSDGQTVYFSRNAFSKGRPEKDANGVIRLKMYRANRTEDGQWGIIEDLPFNSPDYSVAHPALSPDEKQLYFASNRAGGYGSTDLYVIDIKDDGTFGPMTNLGPYINTQGRETFPFVTVDSILYFASDGQFSLGGLDVFATRIKPAYDQPVHNVGSPVNSRHDDFGLIIDSAKEGFFATNRPDHPLTADKMKEWSRPNPKSMKISGDDNIIAFTELRPLIFDCRVTGQVRDRLNRRPLAGVLIEVVNDREERIDTVRTDSLGRYSALLYCNRGNFIRGSLEGYVPSEEFLRTPRDPLTTVDLFLERDIVTLPVDTPEQEADLAKLLALNTIYFDLNKYNIRPDAEVEIQKVIALLRKFPKLKIRVVSHTDSRGLASYNLWLSQKRAESTVAYMAKEGIDESRLLSLGKGEEEILNGCVDGVRCSREEHQLNRRSEFLVYRELETVTTSN